MKLPNREHAIIPSEKLNAYLLSETHPVGKSKAKFFRAFGFDESNVNLLESGLLTIVTNFDVSDSVSTPRGTKYVIDGTVPTPAGEQIAIRTVWIIESAEENPRFVTAYPL